MSEISKDDLAFIAMFNNVEKYPSLKDIGEELGLAAKTIKNRAGILRKRAALDPMIPNIINRHTDKTPMSEDEDRFMESWGADECIEELIRVAELDPDKVISRNYFRVNSLISESTWNRYFGTFEEFKRQAGIKLTRQQHAVERKVALHASVDHYRALGKERKDYGDKYIREKESRFKTLIMGSDFHDHEIDPFFLRVFLDTCERVQPDNISLVGDIFDLPEFGRWTNDPREWDVCGRIKFVHENILKPMRESCPDTQIDHIEGNHEARLLRMLADATPALRAVLSDLHGFTIGKLLGLDEFEINYIAQSDLAAWSQAGQKKELDKNYKVYYDSVLAHHFPHARNMGLPGVNGHHHRHQVWPKYSPIYGAYEWHQMGCGHKRAASYCEAEQWHMGFTIVNVDTYTKSVNFDYIAVSDFAVSGGKWYHRKDDEGIPNDRILVGK